MLGTFTSFLVVGFAAAQGPSLRGAPPKQSELDPLLKHINVYRQSVGLNELMRDPALVQCANATALMMRRTPGGNKQQVDRAVSCMERVGLNTTNKKVGELYGMSNCHASADVCSKLMVEQWKAHPKARAILASKAFNIFGGGVAAVDYKIAGDNMGGGRKDLDPNRDDGFDFENAGDNIHVVGGGRKDLDPDRDDGFDFENAGDSVHVVGGGRKDLDPDRDDGVDFENAGDNIHVVGGGRKDLDPNRDDGFDFENAGDNIHVVGGGRKDVDNWSTYVVHFSQH